MAPAVGAVECVGHGPRAPGVVGDGPLLIVVVMAFDP